MTSISHFLGDTVVTGGDFDADCILRDIVASTIELALPAKITDFVTTVDVLVTVAVDVVLGLMVLHEVTLLLPLESDLNFNSSLSHFTLNL